MTGGLLDYPSPVLPHQTPDAIAAAGLMYGFLAPDPATATVLDIGCSDGLNLAAHAAAFPQSQCVGFDLWEPALETGRARIAAAGLGNIALEHGDILTYPRDGEPFDYISAHGIYCWVPPAVRHATLELIAARLRPGGVGYVTIDALPAAGPKQAIAAVLRARVADIADPAEKVAVAIDLARLLAATQAADSVLKGTLDGLLERIGDYHPSYFLFDWLGPNLAPISVPDFAAQCATVGLTIVGDAGLGDLHTANLTEAAQAMLERAGPDAAARAALIDLLRGDQTFRRLLVARTDALPPRIDDGPLRLRFAFNGSRTPGDGSVHYAAGGAEMTLATPGEIAVLDVLAAAMPQEFTVAEVAAITQQTVATVAPLLIQAAAIGLLQAHATSPPYTLTPGQHPRAGRLIRAMLRENDWAVTLRHVRATAPSDATRLLLILCDGTRDRETLAAILRQELKAEVSTEAVATTIHGLERLCLFEA